MGGRYRPAVGRLDAIVLVTQAAAALGRWFRDGGVHYHGNVNRVDGLRTR